MWLKSMFISVYLTALCLASGYLLFNIPLLSFESALESALKSSLALLATLPLLLMMAYFFAFKSAARTSANLYFLLVLPAISLMALVALSPVPWLSVAIAALALAGNAVYVFWYSRFNREDNAKLAVGKALPDFDLLDEAGKPYPSSRMRQQPSLILFYRGNWCPLCMAQIKEVAKAYQALEARGVSVYLVSAQSDTQTASLADKFSVKMRFMQDKNNQAAEQLDIAAIGGTPMGLQALGYSSDTAMPTVLMTDTSGKIIFADLTDNYRLRPEPEDFLRVFDEYQVV